MKLNATEKAVISHYTAVVMHLTACRPTLK